MWQIDLRMTPEEIARQQIDVILGRCGWTVQAIRTTRLSALVECNLKWAARLRQSVLRRAFEGKLLTR